MFESLESRQYMTMTVRSAWVDNRGEGYLNLSEAANASTVTSSSVMVFTGGTDKVLGTADDVRVLASVKYTPSSNRITFKVKTALAADTGYMVKLFASRLLSATGERLDGEFNGTFSSGNGTPGGDFRLQTKKDRTARPQVRFSTSSGIIDIELFRGSGPTRSTPLNVAHFQGFVNGGDYDNLVVHRVAKNFVVQFGGLNLDPTTNQLGLVDSNGSVNGEGGNSNITGTIAYALSTGPNTADNEFFFNMVDNDGSGLTPNLDDSSNGGPFTVFGRVINGFATLQAINNLHRLNLSQALAGSGSSVDNFPVNASVPVTGETQGSGGTTSKQLDPINDFVYVRRTSERMKVASVA